MPPSGERASKAQPHHQQTHARRREDLDSILDAALDELDKEEEDDEFSDDDNNDDDNNEASDNDVERDKKNNNDDGIVSPSSLRQIGIDYISDDNANYGAESSSSGDSSGGAPYSLEYLAAAKREGELMTASTAAAAAAARRQFFGPEPPPPPSPFDLHATNTSARAGIESEKEGGGDAAFASSSSEFVSSLEDMMKQFAQEIQSVSGGGVGELDKTDEKSLDAMLKTMMFGMDGGGEQQALNRVNKNVPPSSTKNEKSKNKSTNSRSSTANNNAINSNSSSNKTAPKIKKEPNNNDVDESINRLLNGINQASSPSSSTDNGNNNNNSNPMMMGLAGIDPSQIEQFSTNIMSSIMSEFDKMGTKKDTDTVIDSVMKQLLNKELMYEPMKEVCNRFPTYLATNKDVLSIEEYQRYGNQYQYFQKICHIYETEPDNFVRLMELMQDIQEYGQPPVDIIKELAPDLQFDETGMPIMGSGGMPMMFPGMINAGGMGGDEQCCIS
jgi:peroxin-19